jgi:hypothetical protein
MVDNDLSLVIDLKKRLAKRDLINTHTGVNQEKTESNSINIGI